MKTIRITLALVAGLLLMSGTAFAFHEGGVAHCDGCHSMHNSADNPRSGLVTTSDSLMKGSDASSTCLNCHNGSGRYHISSAIGDNTNQGGDFFWVSDLAIQDFDFGHGTPNIQFLEPDNKGHNVLAADFGMTVDATNSVAPGGSYPSANLGCTSCHDPHGQVNGGTSNGTAAISESGSYGAVAPTDGSIRGNYRLLDDSIAAAPVARANSYDGKFVDYGSGMSTWCLGCHTYMAEGNMHPVDEALGGAIGNVYNSYVKTGDFTGTAATAFDALVPIERGIGEGSLLDDQTTAGVVTGSEQVMCLTCHRAHASAFDNALRWDNKHEFLADSAILNEATTTLVANGAIPYYAGGVAVDPATKYGPWQRQLCNKCHAQD